MFENPGDKAIGIAKVIFVLQLIGAGITLIVGAVGGQFLTGLIAAVILALSAWVTAVLMSALGDAAAYAERAASYAASALSKLEKLLPPEDSPTASPKAPPANYGAGYPDSKMPAWQRVEMEKRQNQRSE